MKKVGIMTFHSSRSYGACLQAMATVYAIKNLGYDAEIIDYVNPYEQKRYKANITNIFILIKYWRWLIKTWIGRDEYWLTKAFGNTRDLYSGNISRQHYTNIQQLSSVDYDILLAGSDQIWNAKITDKLDSAFLLNFGHTNKRISYASSIGSYILKQDDIEQFKQYLNHFSYISVREIFAKKQLSNIIDKPIAIVVDPTLLINGNQWKQIIASFKEPQIKKKEKYILTFFVNANTKPYEKEIIYIKKELGYPIYNIQFNRHKTNFANQILAGLTCTEFLQYVENAEYVITDSFHGVVFSILFQKMFTPLSNPANPVRVRELLSSLGLLEYLDCPQMCKKKINYKVINEKLDNLRGESLHWLKTALE